MQEFSVGIEGEAWRLTRGVRRCNLRLAVLLAICGLPDTQEPWGIAIVNEGFVNEDLMWDSEVFKLFTLEGIGSLTTGGNFRFKQYERYVADRPDEKLPYLGGDSEWRMGAFCFLRFG